MAKDFYDWIVHIEKDYYSEVNKSDDTIQDVSLGNNIPKPVIFECGTCNGYTFAATDNILFLTDPYQTCTPKTLGIVTIDTLYLCKPKIKIDFSCNIHFTETNTKGIVQLEFQLFKTSNFDHESPVGSWFFKIQGNHNNSAQTFSFMYCDCNSFSESYQYSVRCQPIEVESASICVTNCHLAALAQSICH